MYIATMSRIFGMPKWAGDMPFVICEKCCTIKDIEYHDASDLVNTKLKSECACSVSIPYGLSFFVHDK
jgi:hypothetical protein